MTSTYTKQVIQDGIMFRKIQKTLKQQDKELKSLRKIKLTLNEVKLVYELKLKTLGDSAYEGKQTDQFVLWLINKILKGEKIG